MAHDVLFGVLLAVLLDRTQMSLALGQCQTRVIECPNDDLYPSFDGSCNNEKHPDWGATGTTLPRLLPSEYDDQVGRPRRQGSYRRLPSARSVSNAMKEATRETSGRVSHLHVLWGQLMAHDFVHTPVVKKENGDPLDCDCENPRSDCVNIGIPKYDEQYRKTGKRCMKLARSKPAEGLNRCEFDQREQINVLSSVIDGSMVYGRTWQDCQDLRDLNSKHGLLRTYDNPTEGFFKLLPTQDDMAKAAISNDTDCKKKVHKPVHKPCFVTGDVRNNENSGLTSITTIWARYHNKIALDLARINPRWHSDTVFNVTRRIVTAALQVITYREYLPHLVGPKWTRRFDLNLAQNGYWNGYDPDCNPAITNEFTTAAFRYGHSQVAESLSRPGSLFRTHVHPPVQSKDSWFNAEPLWNNTGGGVGSIMRGFILDKAEKTDVAFVDDLRNQLFTEFGKRFGDDLFAINTQRGRDHGLPGYNQYREICGLKRASTFEELSNEIPHELLTKLQRVYTHVDDIDLYPGGLAENHVKGGEVGPTFACILSYAFRALRKGDRYWHEYEFSPYPFTRRQLSALRKISFARVLCDVAEEMEYVTKEPLLHSDDVWQEKVPCKRIPTLDLSPWDERELYYHYGNHGQDEERTRWFVTRERSVYDADRHTLSEQLRYEHPEEVCDRVLDSKVRTVPGDDYVQIQFICPLGTIRATDFPSQISDRSHWTAWHLAQPFGYDEGYRVGVDEFHCRNPIAIQAMTVDGRDLARETWDVFEYYDVTRGFSCLNKHQPSGACSRYTVRVLCGYDSGSRVGYNSVPHAGLYPDASHVSDSEPIVTEYLRPDPKIVPVPYGPEYDPSPSRIETPPPPTYGQVRVPEAAADRAAAYCLKYGICCGRGIYTIRSLPPFVRNEAAQLCKKYDLCCDV